MGRRDTLLVAALVAVILVLSAIASQGGGRPGRGDPRATTYGQGNGGTAALLWTLQQLGIPAARREQPWLGDSLPRVMVLLSPYQPPTEEEASVLARHVRAGGTLLYAAVGFDFGSATADTLGVRSTWLPGLSAWDDEVRTAEARRHRWTEGVRAVGGFRRVFNDSSRTLRGAGRVDTLLAVDGRPAAVAWRLGRGVVVAFADARPLTNAHLRESGAALVFARAAAEAARGDTVWFDEYHQGFGGDGSPLGALLEQAGRMIPQGTWIQLALAAALLLLVAGRRFGAPLPPPPLRRRSPLEHVEALAGAYRQADARRTARRLLVAGLARRLGRRAPADDAAAAELLGRMARQSPVAREAAGEIERDWARGAEADLVALARGVDRYLDEVRRP